MLRSCENNTDVAIECLAVTKEFYFYRHQQHSLRELFIRALHRKPAPGRPAGQPHFVIKNFSLTVKKGESVAFIGPNGSGKSTLLRLLAGIYMPNYGNIDVCGRIAAVIELGAGFHPDLTGKENVTIYGTVMGLKRSEIKERYAQIAAFAGLEEFMNMPVKYYSSGMQARLAFAVTVCVEPDILLLDEVLAVGDMAFRAKCFKHLESLRAAGKTLIIATHDLETASRFCSRAVWLDKGTVRLEADVESVRQAYERGSV